MVGAIAPKLEQAEIERAKRKPTESLDAYDYFLRGMASAHRVTRDATGDALQLFAKAIELDPDYASPYGVAAFCYVVRKIERLDRPIARRRSPRPRGWLEGGRAGQGRRGRARLRWARARLCRRATSRARVALIDRALVLNPNLAAAWYASGTVRAFRGGEPDLAIEHLARAMRLSPLDPLMFSHAGRDRLRAFLCRPLRGGGRHGRRRRSGSGPTSWPRYASPPPATHSPAGWRKHRKPSRARSSSIPACGYPISRTGSERSAGRKTTPNMRRRYARPACPSDRIAQAFLGAGAYSSRSGVKTSRLSTGSSPTTSPQCSTFGGMCSRPPGSEQVALRRSCRNGSGPPRM